MWCCGYAHDCSNWNCGNKHFVNVSCLQLQRHQRSSAGVNRFGAGAEFVYFSILMITDMSGWPDYFEQWPLNTRPSQTEFGPNNYNVSVTQVCFYLVTGWLTVGQICEQRQRLTCLHVFVWQGRLLYFWRQGNLGPTGVAGLIHTASKFKWNQLAVSLLICYQYWHQVGLVLTQNLTFTETIH